MGGLVQLALLTIAPVVVLGAIVCLVCCLWRRSQQAAIDEKTQLLNQAKTQTMEVTVPEGAAGGQQIQVNTPAGLVAVQVPAGLGAGQKFQIVVGQPAAGV